MIEVNVKAKPFNPAEDVLGTDLFFMMAECQLVGYHYFCDKPPTDKGRQVLCMPQGSLGGTVKKVTQRGWASQPFKDGVMKYTKVPEVNKPFDTIFLCPYWEMYEKWINAVEVLKLLGVDYATHKDMVAYVHSIIINGDRVKLNDKGEIVGVYPKPKQPTQPPGGFGGQFGEAAAAAAGAVIGGWAAGAGAVMNPAPVANAMGLQAQQHMAAAQAAHQIQVNPAEDIWNPNQQFIGG